MWLEKVTAPSAGAGSPLAAHSHLSFPFLPSQMSRSVLTEVARRWILGQVLSVAAGCPVTPLRQRREPRARSLVSRGCARRSPGPHQDGVVFLLHIPCGPTARSTSSFTQGHGGFALLWGFPALQELGEDWLLLPVTGQGYEPF